MSFRMYFGPALEVQVEHLAFYALCCALYGPPVCCHCTPVIATPFQSAHLSRFLKPSFCGLPPSPRYCPPYLHVCLTPLSHTHCTLMTPSSSLPFGPHPQVLLGSLPLILSCSLSVSPSNIPMTFLSPNQSSLTLCLSSKSDPSLPDFLSPALSFLQTLALALYFPQFLSVGCLSLCLSLSSTECVCVCVCVCVCDFGVSFFTIFCGSGNIIRDPLLRFVPGDTKAELCWRGNPKFWSSPH